MEHKKSNNENEITKILEEDESGKLETKYKMLIQLGSGSFGSVWRIMHKKGKKDYAVKIETKNARSRLKNEYKIYKVLEHANMQGIPKIKEYFETNKNCYLIMELLGKSLDNLLNENTNPFDLSTVLKLGISIVSLLENVHNNGFVHRDIKPNNFLINTKEKSDKVYIMDFGLSKKYLSSNGDHINPREDRSLVGTARYASINVHMGFEPSRRDDLESVGYMLLFFLKKKLPWQGLKKKKDMDQIKLIGECKMKISLDELCEKLPQCFKDYIKYCRGLKFSETPDYKYLKRLFLDTAIKLDLTPEFYWVYC